MAEDHINVIERAIIDKLRTDHSGIRVYGQYPEAIDAEYPCIIMELTSSGEFDRFMGQKVDFNGTSKTGELVGLVFTIHTIVDKESKKTVSGEVFKQRRLLNYLLLNVANSITDMTFSSSTVEITERDLGNWVDIGYDPELELYGGSCVYTVVFKNYR
ncbi:MAG: hypothetical protein CMM25_00675 [Rhodospirillaceae bacterium]|nr:hypothetical protein [Rhodospirillaceae bacterium]